MGYLMNISYGESHDDWVSNEYTSFENHEEEQLCVPKNTVALFWRLGFLESMALGLTSATSCFTDFRGSTPKHAKTQRP